jgi:hypothetical protein
VGKVWIYCQEPGQLLDGSVPDAWRKVAAGFLVQLPAPDLYPHPDDAGGWFERLSNALQRAREGVRSLPWVSVSQATNRGDLQGASGRSRLLYAWSDSESWARLCARVTVWAQAAKRAGAKGLCFDFEDYARRFGGARPMWPGTGLGLPGRTPLARGTQWRDAADAGGLPVSLLGDATGEWDYPIWKQWARTLTRGTAAAPLSTEFWTEDCFATPTEDRFSAVRAGFAKRTARTKIAAGLIGAPPTAVNHRLAALAYRRGLECWCYPWGTR